MATLDAPRRHDRIGKPPYDPKPGGSLRASSRSPRNPNRYESNVRGATSFLRESRFVSPSLHAPLTPPDPHNPSADDATTAPDPRRPEANVT